MIALPEKFDACLPKSTSFQSSSICPTFSAFTFSSWSLENEERLMEDGKDVQQEKVIGTGKSMICVADYNVDSVLLIWWLEVLFFDKKSFVLGSCQRDFNY